MFVRNGGFDIHPENLRWNNSGFWNYKWIYKEEREGARRKIPVIRTGKPCLFICSHFYWMCSLDTPCRKIWHRNSADRSQRHNFVSLKSLKFANFLEIPRVCTFTTVKFHAKLAVRLCRKFKLRPGSTKNFWNPTVRIKIPVLNFNIFAVGIPFTGTIIILL